MRGGAVVDGNSARHEQSTADVRAAASANSVHAYGANGDAANRTLGVLACGWRNLVQLDDASTVL
jgi:hypothetical protein